MNSAKADSRQRKCSRQPCRERGYRKRRPCHRRTPVTRERQCEETKKGPTRCLTLPSAICRDSPRDILSHCRIVAFEQTGHCTSAEEPPRCCGWTATCSGFRSSFICNFVREICAIRGQKYNHIFTTDGADNADESRRLQRTNLCSKNGILAFPLHAGRTNGTSHVALSN